MHTAFNFNEISTIIGLGNPTPEYANTYHNVGMQLLNRLLHYLAEHFEEGVPRFTQSTTLPVLYERVKVNRYTFIKPLTYMNESGSAVLSFMRYFKIKPESLLIIHDDSDLSVGAFKYSFGVGDAGHNGIKSIFSSLGTRDFWRLRIGVRNPETRKNARAETFVLSQITREDSRLIEEAFLESLKLLSQQG